MSRTRGLSRDSARIALTTAFLAGFALGCRPASKPSAPPTADLTAQAAPSGLLDSAWSHWQRQADRSRINACALLVSADADTRRQVDSVARSLGVWPRGASIRVRDSICAAVRGGAPGRDRSDAP